MKVIFKLPSKFWFQYLDVWWAIPGNGNQRPSQYQAVIKKSTINYNACTGMCMKCNRIAVWCSFHEFFFSNSFFFKVSWGSYKRYQKLTMHTNHQLIMTDKGLMKLILKFLYFSLHNFFFLRISTLKKS